MKDGSICFNCKNFLSIGFCGRRDSIIEVPNIVVFTCKWYKEVKK